MAATSAMVTRIDPGVSGDSRLSDWLTIANASVSAQTFGVWKDEAAAALCAHYLRSMPTTGSGRTVGAVQSESFVDRSITYSAPTATDWSSPAESALAATTGGAYYLHLLHRMPKTGLALLG